ncbi:MAG: hypothetical protein DK306_001205 [Chloroflexi bacterium]|nr:MAG: hypothetical protein DK306_001205 [Chloroflexota bacterium]
MERGDRRGKWEAGTFAVMVVDHDWHEEWQEGRD